MAAPKERIRNNKRGTPRSSANASQTSVIGPGANASDQGNSAGAGGVAIRGNVRGGVNVYNDTERLTTLPLYIPTPPVHYIHRPQAEQDLRESLVNETQDME
jgi:hypothetical protein